MDPYALRLTETLSVSDDFSKAEEELCRALARLEDDDAKWGLIKHLAPRFEALQARHNGLEVSVDRSFDRDFAISELRLMIKEKKSLAVEINTIMDQLEN